MDVPHGDAQRATPAGGAGSSRLASLAGAPRRARRFVREVVAELRKVIYPNRTELITYVTVVLVFISAMVAFVAGLDYVFTKAVLGIFG